MLAFKGSKKDFINSTKALEIGKVSQDHIKMLSMMIFRTKIDPSTLCVPGQPKFNDQKNKQNMTLICILFGLCQLHEDSHGLYECGYFKSGIEYPDMILSAIKEINLTLRP